MIPRHLSLIFGLPCLKKSPVHKNLKKSRDISFGIRDPRKIPSQSHPCFLRSLSLVQSLLEGRNVSILRQREPTDMRLSGTDELNIMNFLWSYALPICLVFFFICNKFSFPLWFCRFGFQLVTCKLIQGFRCLTLKIVFQYIKTQGFDITHNLGVLRYQLYHILSCTPYFATPYFVMYLLFCTILDF